MLTPARVLVAVLLLTVLVQPALAQDVAAPAVPASAGGIVGLCALLDAKIKECKKKICECPLGQLLTNSTKVFNTYAGGLLCPSCCPEVKEDDLKKPANSLQGACARIRQEEAEAPSRRAAVRCLAYADCNWYPEAEAALIIALRTDRNECVRYEAAQVLGSGCCCTRKSIQALALAASGSKKDGNPPENSPRVKAAAYVSLQHCLNCFAEIEELDPLPKPESPERLPDPRKLPETTAFQMIEPAVALRPMPVPVDPVIADARAVLAQLKVSAIETPAVMPTGHRSIYEAMVRASAPPAKPAAAVPPTAAPTPEPPQERKPRSLFEWFAGRKDGGAAPVAVVPRKGPEPAFLPEPAAFPEIDTPATVYPTQAPQQ